MQSNNIFQTPVSTEPRVPGMASTPVRPDFVAIPSGAGDEGEKKQFIQTILITFGICSVITVILFFLLLSNSSEASSATAPTKYTVKDDPIKRTIPTPRKLPPTPTRKPSPTLATQSKTTLGPTPTGFLTPTSLPTLTPTVTPTGTLTPTVTPTASPTPTPTSSVLLFSADNLNLGTVLVNEGDSWAQILMKNNTSGPVNFTDFSFATTGITNPFSFLSEADCLSNSNLPYTIPPGSSKCIRVKYKPTTSATLTTNTVYVYWNSGNYRTFTVTGTSTAPTATPTLTATPTSTPTPTPSGTPTPTPISGSVTFSTDYSSGTLDLSYALINSATTWAEMQIRNNTSSSISLTDLFFSTAGSTNPFSILDEAGCLTNSALPYTLAANTSKCLRIKFTPVTGNSPTNTVIIYWNTSNLKYFTVFGTIITPTLTPTPTPTRTPTPVP